MSIVKIPEERKENFSLVLRPEIDYLSSSVRIDGLEVEVGVSGSAPLRRRPSPFVKELEPQQDPQLNPGQSSFNESTKGRSINLDQARKLAISASLKNESVDVSAILGKYLIEVNSSSMAPANTKKIFITRFDPPFSHNDVSMEKSIIQNNLMKFYESRYDLCEMSYTNYHTLNFFSAPNTPAAPVDGEISRMPDDSAIIYQNFTTTAGRPRPYSPSGSFSFDFYLNPRYTNESGSYYNAGTIMHLSSTYALSLISGSAKDQNDLASGFKLLLQLSHSADIPPSEIDFNSVGTYPYDLIFTSSDNSLSKNYWHHCTVRWGTNLYNQGTGSFVIDGSSTHFVVPSSSILPPKNITCSSLLLGNYYESNDNEAKFFNKSTENEGVSPVLDFGAGANIDPAYILRHPLNAEIHEVKLYKKYLKNTEIQSLGNTSPTSFEDLMFYVPPFFIPNVKNRDMLITPFQSQLTSSIHPFNEIFSFGVGGFVMNLENHVVDFATQNNPRCLNLAASTIDRTIENITATQFVYGTGSIKKRNLTVLPNDNGWFKPDYNLVASYLTGSSFGKSSVGGKDLSIISLRDMISKSRVFPGIETTTVGDLSSDSTDSDTIANNLAGVTPEGFTGDPGPILTIAQRTRDFTSNEICFFDISNLYYGNKIGEGTFYISDPIFTGSDGKIRMTVRDNKQGGMYRSDADGPHPTWSNLGNVLYEDGISIIKNPSLTFFGKDCFELKCKGEQATHITMYNILLSEGAFNSSSNPMYIPVSASDSASDKGKKFVYIDSLNIHDENLNVIARSNFAQPIKKMISDSMLIRFKMDF